MTRKTLCAVALMLVLGACGTGSSATTSSTTPSTSADVELRGVAFTPKVLEVERGDEVTWANRDDVDLHTVTSGVPQKQGIPGVKEDVPSRPDGMFDHDLTSVGDEFTFTFEEAGTFIYFCEVHAGMTGKIVVKS